MPRIVFAPVLTLPHAFHSRLDRRTVVVAHEWHSAANSRRREAPGELMKIGRGETIWEPCRALSARIPKNAKDVYRADLREAKARLRGVLQNG